jgi:hypothetical protein
MLLPCCFADAPARSVVWCSRLCCLQLGVSILSPRVYKICLLASLLCALSQLRERRLLLAVRPSQILPANWHPGEQRRPRRVSRRAEQAKVAWYESCDLSGSAQDRLLLVCPHEACVLWFVLVVLPSCCPLWMLWVFAHLSFSPPFSRFASTQLVFVLDLSDGETELDVQWETAMAPGVKVKPVHSTASRIDSANLLLVARFCVGGLILSVHSTDSSICFHCFGSQTFDLRLEILFSNLPARITPLPC